MEHELNCYRCRQWPCACRDGACMLLGDCREILRQLPAESVDCCVTSPPYWGLRDYGIPGSIWGGDPACEHSWDEPVAVHETNHTDKRRWNHTRNGRDEEQPVEKRVGWKRQVIEQGQFCGKCGAWFGALGLEPTPDLYCEHMVEIFAAVSRALRDDGTLWLNLGDSYNGYMANQRATSISANNQHSRPVFESGHGRRTDKLKAKDLVGIPWRVAFALQANGWYLRQDIIWAKPNPMPESVTDRCTKAHEYLFLLSKSKQYHYDADLIAEPCEESNDERPRMGQGPNTQYNQKRKTISHLAGGVDDGPHDSDSWVTGKRQVRKSGNKVRKPASERGVPSGDGGNVNGGVAGSIPWEGEKRNKRSVWTIPIKPYPQAHFATFPPDLIKPCILAGCPERGTVLDPFLGSGTTAAVAVKNRCCCIGIELNEDYIKLAANRLRQGVLEFTD